MENQQLQQPFDVDDLISTKRWFKEKGYNAFNTISGLDWFIRNHRQALLKSGQFFPGRGQAPSLVGPGFGQVVVQILQAKAAARITKVAS